MKCTITMPDGLKVKVQSERRYVVVGYSPTRTRWEIEKRSDNEQTVLAEWRAMTRRGQRPSHIIDTAKREVIK